MIENDGGIIAVRPCSDIVNDGALISNGSDRSGYGGGATCLCADGVVINHGAIECRPYERIMFRCRQFVYEAEISLEPEVFVTDGMGSE